MDRCLDVDAQRAHMIHLMSEICMHTVLPSCHNSQLQICSRGPNLAYPGLATTLERQAWGRDCRFEADEPMHMSFFMPLSGQMMFTV
jgi:hypothetical protein